jgi:hypothetical protein
MQARTSKSAAAWGVLLFEEKEGTKSTRKTNGEKARVKSEMASHSGKQTVANKNARETRTNSATHCELLTTNLPTIGCLLMIHAAGVP